MAESRVVTTIAELRGLIGQELGVGPWNLVTQEMVNAYADLSDDHQWIHVDPERAKRESPFGGTIAHGFLVLSLLPLLSRKLEGIRVELPRKMAINYGVNKVRFITPVRVGTRIRMRTKLLSVEEPKPSTFQIIYQQTIESEAGGDRPAAVVEAIQWAYL